jgi:hypothetical protein
VPFDPSSAANPAPAQRYNLAQIVQRSKPTRRKEIVLRPILPTLALASDLYAACYRPLVSAITASIPSIVAAYERGLPIRDGLVTDSTDQAQQETASLGDQLQRIVMTLVPALRSWTARVDRWHRNQWRGAALNATGVDLDLVLMGSGTPTSVAETIAWNTALMKDVSAQAQQKISSAVFAAFQARKPAADLASDLRDIAGFSRRRSLGIASDQLSKLSAALDTERMSDAGIEEFRYHHSLKKHPRKWHQARDGRYYELKSGKEVGGDDVIEPGDMPGAPPWCGCRKQAVLRLD